LRQLTPCCAPLSDVVCHHPSPGGCWNSVAQSCGHQKPCGGSAHASRSSLHTSAFSQPIRHTGKLTNQSITLTIRPP
jgi:hypothetical protein